MATIDQLGLSLSELGNTHKTELQRAKTEKQDSLFKAMTHFKDSQEKVQGLRSALKAEQQSNEAMVALKARADEEAATAACERAAQEEAATLSLTQLALRSIRLRWLNRSTARRFRTWVVRSIEARARAQLAEAQEDARRLKHDLHFWSGAEERGGEGSGGAAARGHVVLKL